jgi:hypothetical protein
MHWWAEKWQQGVHAMDYDTWIALFSATLVELRPHLSARMAHSVGEHEYTADNTNPKATARAYHVRHGGTLPTVKR